MKKWLLPVILLLITAPLLVFLLFTGYNLNSRAMKSIVEHYAETLAKDLAIGYIMELQLRDAEEKDELQHAPIASQAIEMIQDGPPVDGWVGIFDSKGNLIEGSKGSCEREEISTAIKDIFKNGGTRKVYYGSDIAAIIGWDGEKVGSEGEYAAVVSVSRYLFPPDKAFSRGMMYVMFYYTYAAIAVIGLSLFGIALLRKYCISPLRHLTREIAGLEWGRDTLSISSVQRLPEMEGLQKAISELSETAVKREQLKKAFDNSTARIREDEKDNLSNNLHDGPLQNVMAISRELGKTDKFLECLEEKLDDEDSSGELMRVLLRSKYLAGKTIKDLRKTCEALSPQWLRLGMSNMLGILSKKLTEEYGVNLETSLSVNDRAFTNLHTREIYHIISIATERAVYDGKARNVNVKISALNQEEFLLAISDDGKSLPADFAFSPEPTKMRLINQPGLAEIMERTYAIGGSFQMRAQKTGVALTITVPCVISEEHVKAVKEKFLDYADFHELRDKLHSDLGININLEITADVPQGSFTYIASIVQQAVINAVNNGKAKNAWVSFVSDEKNNILSIRDDGVGLAEDLDLVKKSTEGHRGTTNMKEDARSLGGTYSLSNAEGGGAVVKVVIPRTDT